MIEFLTLSWFNYQTLQIETKNHPNFTLGKCPQVFLLYRIWGSTKRDSLEKKILKKLNNFFFKLQTFIHFKGERDHHSWSSSTLLFSLRLASLFSLLKEFEGFCTMLFSQISLCLASSFLKQNHPRHLSICKEFNLCEIWRYLFIAFVLLWVFLIERINEEKKKKFIIIFW